MKNFLLKQIVVWLIIFTGLIIFSVFTYIIATNKSHFLSITAYKTLLAESSGIYAGTKVTINGINTGNIIKIKLLPDGQVEVLFSVRKSHVFAITESSVVQLKNSGALGDRFINILTEDLSARPLQKGSLIPYQESFSLLSFLTGDGENSKQSIQGLIVRINKIFNSIDKKGVSGLLSQSHQEDLTQILKSAKNILKKVESGQGTLGALVNDRSLYNRLLVLLGQRPTKNYLQDLSQKSQESNK